MLRFTLPFCLMLMSLPSTARANDTEFLTQFLGPNPGMYIQDPYRSTCRYSFYWGRYWIQIVDQYGNKMDCQYFTSETVPNRESVWGTPYYNHYACNDGSTVRVFMSSLGRTIAVQHLGVGDKPYCH